MAHASSLIGGDPPTSVGSILQFDDPAGDNWLTSFRTLVTNYGFSLIYTDRGYEPAGMQSAIMEDIESRVKFDRLRSPEKWFHTNAEEKKVVAIY